MYEWAAKRCWMKFRSAERNQGNCDRRCQSQVAAKAPASEKAGMIKSLRRSSRFASFAAAAAVQKS